MPKMFFISSAPPNYSGFLPSPAVPEEQLPEEVRRAIANDPDNDKWDVGNWIVTLVPEGSGS
jgi:hypothetical protein